MEIPVFVERQVEKQQEEPQLWDPTRSIESDQMVHSEVALQNEQGQPLEQEQVQ